jgi:UDP-GlcNAc3NAcA epimerase
VSTSAGKVVTIVGARPQLIKAAAVSRVLRRVNRADEILVHTGQHFDRDMSDVFFEELGIPAPDHHLGIGGGSQGQMTGRMIESLEAVLIDVAPAVVLVYGDTNSTLAGAITAAKLHIPVAHVEAGLRSFNRRMPEEINRLVTDHVSELLFCPTSTAATNLANEGVRRGVHLVGDVMYDATLDAAEKSRASRILDELGLGRREYAVATVHRAENTDTRESLERVITYLRDHASTQPVVLPLHPRTRHAAVQWDVDLAGLTVVGPLGYLDMTRLVQDSAVVLTDSGGLQKEAYFHRVPCVTLRDETEWVETIECGWNRLWGVDGYRPRRDVEEYGDGHAAESIVTVMLEWLASRDGTS